jgi:uncharacterized protein YbaR (Trm112 family)
MVRYYHLEILACPECRNPRLIVYPVREAERDEEIADPEKLKCRRWCYLYDRPASTVPLKTCVSTCMRRDIDEGVIVCVVCGRWYPIVKGIPVLMDDKYRDRERDEEIAERLKPLLPSWVKQNARLPIPLAPADIEG